MAVSAFAVAFGLLADEPAASGLINKAGFEEENYSLESSEGGSYYWTQPTGDASSIKSYGGEGLTAPTIRTKEFAGTDNAKYLELSTEGGTLLRGFKPTDAADKTQAVGDGVYIDTLVQFTAMEDSDPTIDPADKIAVWLGVKAEDNVTTTNLYVKAAALDGDLNATPATFSLTYANGGTLTVEPEQWYRLTIKAGVIVDDSNSDAELTYFRIFLNGQSLKAVGTAPTDAANALFADNWLSEDLCAQGVKGELFPSLKGFLAAGLSGASLTAVGFAGSGAIDDLVLTTDDPLETSGGGTTVLITLSVPTGVTGSYSVDGGTTWTAIPANGSVSVEKDSGIWLKGTVGVYEQVKKFTATEDATLAITTATSDMAWYFPRTETEGQDGTSAETAFEIATANDLVALKDAVAAGVATAGVYFKQTADIDMASVESFAGIGVYSSGANGTCFAGVYDGDNKKISNVNLDPNKNYAGVFNQVADGTVQNLVIDTVVVKSGNSEGEYGAALAVGHVRNGVIKNVTTMGTLTRFDNKVFNHNVAGIVVRIDGSTIENCTNLVNLVGAYTKAAGIVALSQNQTGSAGKCVIKGCVNKGSVTLDNSVSGKKVDGAAGIIGYSCVANGTDIIDCSNEGIISTTLKSGVTQNYKASLVGWAYSGVTACSGCSAQADIVSVAAVNRNTVDENNKPRTPGDFTGLTYATVADGVATFVTTPVAGGSYKVLAAGSTETATIELTEVGQTFALDQSLKTVPADKVSVSTTIAHAVTPVPSVIENGVTTWTATQVAKWTVTYMNGETEVKSIEVWSDDTSTLANTKPETDPTEDGKTFLGWATAADATVALTEYDIEGNVTFYAIFEAAAAGGIVVDLPITDGELPSDSDKVEAINTAWNAYKAEYNLGTIAAADQQKVLNNFLLGNAPTADDTLKVTIDISEGVVTVKAVKADGTTEIVTTPGKLRFRCADTLEGLKAPEALKDTVDTSKRFFQAVLGLK